MKLRELGEFGFIDRIAGMVSERNGVRIGIGDDAAAIETSPGHLSLVTSDMLVEGVHFDLSFTDPFRLGRKSLAVNLSDIAAMGGLSRHFLLSLAIPPHLTVEFLDGFVGGLLGMAEEFNVTLIGGDTCRSTGGLVISITLHGEQVPDLVVRRNGARPGDLIFVTGTLGDSALGLAQLGAGEREGEAIERHLNPIPRTRAGMAIAEAGLATSMIDISDGLLADLGHILKLSCAGAKIELDRLPLSPFFREKAPLLSSDPHSLALAGGEDYELLFTVRPDRASEVETLMAGMGEHATAVGMINSSGMLSVLSSDGRQLEISRTGYNHFTGET